MALLALAVAACGGDGAAVDATSTIPVPTTSTIAVTSTVAAVPTTTMAPATTTTSPSMDVELAGGEVSGPEVIEVALGEEVDVWILSDLDDELHVHGYDLYFDLEAGVPFNLSFPADVPGVFEVEVHTGHTLLFELEVAG